jgi:ketosteroid isomerase-like protein
MSMDGGEAIDRLFDALARGDIEGIRASLAPHARVWHSFDCIAHDREAAVASLAQTVAAFAERRVEDVRRQPSTRGFVQQHLFVVRSADGSRKAWPVCIVVEIADGVITRLDEYIDRAGFFVPKEGDLSTPGF